MKNPHEKALGNVLKIMGKKTRDSHGVEVKKGFNFPTLKTKSK